MADWISRSGFSLFRMSSKLFIGTLVCNKIGTMLTPPCPNPLRDKLTPQDLDHETTLSNGRSTLRKRSSCRVECTAIRSKQPSGDVPNSRIVTKRHFRPRGVSIVRNLLQTRVPQRSDDFAAKRRKFFGTFFRIGVDFPYVYGKLK